jgi:hypothetical protein
MKASDISDEVMLEAIRATRGRNNVPRWATTWDVQKRLNTFHPKIVLAKLRGMLKRKLIDGCGCGCRGDWEIPGEVK